MSFLAIFGQVVHVIWLSAGENQTSDLNILPSSTPSMTWLKEGG